KLEALQNLFSVHDQRFQFRVRIFLAREFDEFNLIELMLPENPAYVFSVRASFTAKAWGIRRKFDREPFAIDDFVAKDIRHRDFSRWYEVVIRIANLKEILFKLGQLAGGEQALRVRHERRHDFGVAMLLRVYLEH